MQHNEILLAINEDGNLNKENINERWNSMRNDFAKDNNIDVKATSFEDVNSLYNSVNKLKSDSPYLSISALADNLFNSNEIDIIQKQYLCQLDTLFETYYGTSNFSDIIYNFESTVSNDNSLSEEQKNVIYIASSVSRHSEEFWEDARINPNNPYHSNFSKKSTKGWRFWVIAGSDVAGAIAGWFASFGNPMGALGGGAAGSVLAYNIVN